MPFENENQLARKHHLQGRRFGKWTAIEFRGGTKGWLCRCECGTDKVIPTFNLLRGKSAMCRSCSSKEVQRQLGRSPLSRRGKLEDYGITFEQYKQAKDGGLKWCHFHKRFESPENFNNPRSSNRCRVSDDERKQSGPKPRFSSRRFQVLWSRYRITEREYLEMERSQDGLCALCGRPWSPLAVDHDRRCCPGRRSCGKCRRGLLCLHCNNRLGHVEDAEWMEKALAYLAQFRKAAHVQTNS